MGGRVRTVTIGPASVITEAQAITVARRVLAHAFIGNDPAETRKRVQAAPTWSVFLDEYWRAASPGWKPSTRKSQGVYRRCYLDPAFPDLTIDAIGQPEVTRWFARHDPDLWIRRGQPLPLDPQRDDGEGGVLGLLARRGATPAAGSSATG